MVIAASGHLYAKSLKVFDPVDTCLPRNIQENLYAAHHLQSSRIQASPFTASILHQVAISWGQPDTAMYTSPTVSTFEATEF